MEHKVVLDVTMNSDDIVNLLSMEGGGFDYWAEICFDEATNEAARTRLNASKGEEIVCYEDILVDILEHGDKLTVYDREEDKDHELTLEKLLAGFKKYAEDVYRKGSIGLDDMDAIVADQILQMAIFGELTYS